MLDEVANIAPLPDLPAIVSEGGGQGLVVLACLQDLSQARGRWGAAADGFFSLFGTKIVLPGIGDLRTLEAVSRLAGQADVGTRSLSTSAWWSRRPSANTTYSTRRQDVLPVDQVHGIAPGTAVYVNGGRPPRPVRLTPWWHYPPFREARWAPAPVAAGGAPEASIPAPAATRAVPLALTPPPPPAPPTAPEDGALPVTWRRVPGQRRSPPPPQA